MMTDPIADLLTRIRNGIRITRRKVDIPHSRIKEGVLGALQREGFIEGFEVLDTLPGKTLRVSLKYSDNDDPAIRVIQRESKPGRRVYHRVDGMPKVLSGLGIGVYSTPKGILTDKDCRKERVGGEYLCSVY